MLYAINYRKGTIFLGLGTVTQRGFCIFGTLNLTNQTKSIDNGKRVRSKMFA